MARAGSVATERRRRSGIWARLGRALGGDRTLEPAATEAQAPSIGPEVLERMARVARDLPGRTVSIARPRPAGDENERWPRRSGVFLRQPRGELEMRIDGIAAEEIVERCYDTGEIAIGSVED